MAKANVTNGIKATENGTSIQDNGIQIDMTTLVDMCPVATDPARYNVRLKFLRELHAALTKKNGGSTGKPDLDVEMIAAWGPVPGTPYTMPFDGQPIPEVYMPKALPVATTVKGKAVVGRPTMVRVEPSPWGKDVLAKLATLRASTGEGPLTVPVDCYAIAGDNSLVASAGDDFDSLPTDLHRSRVIWSLWVSLGKAGNKLALIHAMLSKGATPPVTNGTGTVGTGLVVHQTP